MTVSISNQARLISKRYTFPNFFLCSILLLLISSHDISFQITLKTAFFGGVSYFTFFFSFPTLARAALKEQWRMTEGEKEGREHARREEVGRSGSTDTPKKSKGRLRDPAL